MDEVWQPIPGFPHYEASDRGNVRSLDRRTPHPKFPRGFLRRGRVLTFYRHKRGHLAVKVYENGKSTLPLVSHVVWLAFKGPIPPAAAILHRDGNKQNNRPDNLELAEDYWNSGDNKATKLTPEKVRAIRAIRETEGLLHRELAEQFGVSDTLIQRVLCGKAWKHV